MSTTTSAPTPVRRRPRWGRRLLVTAVILVLLLVVLDRVADKIAEHVAAQMLQSSQHLQRTPQVSIGGFPFLTQLISGSYDDVTVSSDQVAVGNNRNLTITKLAVKLNQLEVSHNFSHATAKGATSVATISYADLSKAVSTKVHATATYGGSGQIKFTWTATFAGRTLVATATATAQLDVAQQTLHFTNRRGAIAGVDLPESLLDVVTIPIPITGLPYGLTVQSLTAGDSAVQITMTATNLTFTK